MKGSLEVSAPFARGVNPRLLREPIYFGEKSPERVVDFRFDQLIINGMWVDRDARCAHAEACPQGGVPHFSGV